VIKPSGREIGAGVMACTDVAANKTRVAPIIDLIICSSVSIWCGPSIQDLFPPAVAAIGTTDDNLPLT
jgi:hypothetical protein